MGPHHVPRIERSREIGGMKKGTPPPTENSDRWPTVSMTAGGDAMAESLPAESPEEERSFQQALLMPLLDDHHAMLSRQVEGT